MSDDLLLRATVLPNGSGGFVVQPGKPLREVGTIQAAKMLGISRTTMWELRHGVSPRHTIDGSCSLWKVCSPT